MTIPIKIIAVKEYLKDNKKPEQEEVWDSISNPWKEYRVGKLPIVVEFLENKKGKIIDLGCGSGRNMIKKDGVEYYGVDFSSGQLVHAIDYAKSEKINSKFFKLSVDRLSKKEFKDEMFDSGLFIATLHCLETKKQRDDALKELYRILKKNAEALISVWDSEDKRFNGLKGDIYMSWKEDGVPYMRYYYLYGKQELIDLLEKVGFRILEIYKSREKDRFSRKNWILRIKK
ncbi:MAG: class I SAM-dependent methyltransferase [Candidatus Pacearchaeota archaeon]|jgi:ubiquinone/menaquinone biosynthesis C-methylase UbiE